MSNSEFQAECRDTHRAFRLDDLKSGLTEGRMIGPDELRSVAPPIEDFVMGMVLPREVATQRGYTLPSLGDASAARSAGSAQ